MISLNIEDEDFHAWFYLDEAYFKAELYEKAREAFTHALEINDNSKGIWINLGVTYIELKEYDKAIDALNQALKVRPNKEEIREFFTEFSEAYKNYRIRINEDKEAIKYTWFYLARAYYKKKEYQKASKACKVSLKIVRKFSKALDLHKKILLNI